MIYNTLDGIVSDMEDGDALVVKYTDGQVDVQLKHDDGSVTYYAGTMDGWVPLNGRTPYEVSMGTIQDLG